MKVAISEWQGRVSPVFDVSESVSVHEQPAPEGAEPVRLSLPPNPRERAEALAEANVEHLLCGAVSRPLRDALAEHGVQVWGFLSGRAEDLLAAFQAGRLADEAFAMPGCRRRRNRHARPPRSHHHDRFCPHCGALTGGHGGRCRRLACPQCGNPTVPLPENA